MTYTAVAWFLVVCSVVSGGGVCTSVPTPDNNGYPSKEACELAGEDWKQDSWLRSYTCVGYYQ